MRVNAVGLGVEAVPWEPKPRSPHRRDDDMVYVRIAYHKTELRDRAKHLRAIWRKEQRLWEITLRDSKRLGIVDRIVEGDGEDPSTHRHAPEYSALHK